MSGLPQGAWQDRDDATFGLLVEGGTLWAFQNGDLQRAAQAFPAGDGKWKACAEGRESPLDVSAGAATLTLRDPWTKELRRLHPAPSADWKPEPLPLPPTKPLSSAEVEIIQAEIWQRHQEDLDALGTPRKFDPAESWKQPPADADFWNPAAAANVTANRNFLRQLVSRVGWIDVERFGYATAFEAGLLLLHSKDPRLLMAALPMVQRDVESGKLLGDSYALTYDKLQILLGRKQRFGSQVGSDAHGPYALPTEDSGQVEERRQQLGLVPLSRYLAVFGATEVRFSSDCAGLAP